MGKDVESVGGQDVGAGHEAEVRASVKHVEVHRALVLEDRAQDVREALGWYGSRELSLITCSLLALRCLSLFHYAYVRHTAFMLIKQNICTVDANTEPLLLLLLRQLEKSFEP